MAVFMASCDDSPQDSKQELRSGLEEEKTTTAATTTTETIPANSEETNSALPLSGGPRRNRYLQLQVFEAGFDPASPKAPPGLRYFTAGLRGTSRSTNDVALEIKPFVFAQNERGCISRPIADANWLKRPFGDAALFSRGKFTEGHLAFLVPDDTERLRILIAPASGEGFAVPAGDDFTPEWPTPVRTIEDGSVLQVLVLPSPKDKPQPPAATSHENIVLDFLVKNLKSTQGIEFATSQQLRLIDADGQFVQPSSLTSKLGCRLDDGDVIPPGQVRRFLAVYEFPVGAPRRLEYRGFEVDTTTVDLE